MSRSSNSLVALPPEPADALMHLGWRLRARRLAENMTVEQAVERLMCSPTTYRNLEAGRPTVSLGLLAMHCGCSVRWMAWRGFVRLTWQCWTAGDGDVPALPRPEYATMNATSDLIYAGLYLPGDEAATPAALLKLWRSGLRESGEFAYGLQYLDNPQALALNPQHLPLRREAFRLQTRLLRDGGALPLTLKDALPDAWGRLVVSLNLGGRIPGDRELLLLANEDRVGAMVFSEMPEMPVPAELPHDDLGQLAEAARRLQYDMEIPAPLLRLLQRGGSLGGARPKASFTHDQALWLAKFPAAGDPVDVQVLEAAMLGLAMRCGIRVPQFFTLPVGRGDTAFLSRRFDRFGPDSRQRLHFLSASALLDIPYESDAGSYVALRGNYVAGARPLLPTSPSCSAAWSSTC